MVFIAIFISSFLTFRGGNILTTFSAENVVRILPPLNVKKEEINIAINTIKKVCSTYK